jgi:hypothetical protein
MIAFVAVRMDMLTGQQTPQRRPGIRGLFEQRFSRFFFIKGNLVFVIPEFCPYHC